MSSEIKSWVVVSEPDLICRLMFTDNVKRLDVRALENFKYTKYGVSLSNSEINFCMAFAESFDKVQKSVCFYKLTAEKKSDKSFFVQKEDKPGCETPVEFWKSLKPFKEAIQWLISSSTLPIEILMDLCFLTTQISKDEMINRKWKHITSEYTPSRTSFLFYLGLVKPDEAQTRKIDIDSLDRFMYDDPILFDSLVQFLYINAD